MPSQMPYQKTISNDYLNKTKTIKAYTEYELENKIKVQLNTWSLQESRQRERQRISNLKEQAEFMDKEVKMSIENYKSILNNITLRVPDSFNWNSLKDNSCYPGFSFTKTIPVISTYFAKFSVPEKGFLEKIFEIIKKIFKIQNQTFLDFPKNKRLSIENKATKAFNRDMETFEEEKQEAINLYNQKRNDFEAKKINYNKDIEKWEADFIAGDTEAVEKFSTMIVSSLKFPENIENDFELSYDRDSKTLIIYFNLPTIQNINLKAGYKYVASKKTIEPILMKQKELESLYNDIIYQLTLYVIHEIFIRNYNQNIQCIAFNGWVHSIDKSTGNDFDACIISVLVDENTFKKINISKVDPKECLRSLKAISAPSLATVTPIKPILKLNRTDSRFIESKDILDTLDDETNLIDMPWEDFEYLVRELFAKIFSQDGAEVKVTQASKDGGVDAIAFDPDPIRGGKFVIQAKRYSKVVPVSATRDLYGTMINEGASKGILVTTSHFGSDTYDFAKDKPISLIDGSNLLHMLNEYGYKAKISV